MIGEQLTIQLHLWAYCTNKNKHISFKQL